MPAVHLEQSPAAVPGSLCCCVPGVPCVPRNCFPLAIGRHELEKKHGAGKANWGVEGEAQE